MLGLTTGLAAQQGGAQAPAATVVAGTGELRGRVQDTTTKKRVEYATVLLLPAEGTSPVASTTCDEQDRFELKRLPAGSFRLQLSFVGYAPHLEPATVASGVTDLGALTLTAAAQKLGEVAVTGQRPLLVQRQRKTACRTIISSCRSQVPYPLL
jgi:ferric enterobactin receptor